MMLGRLSYCSLMYMASMPACLHDPFLFSSDLLQQCRDTHFKCAKHLCCKSVWLPWLTPSSHLASWCLVCHVHLE